MSTTTKPAIEDRGGDEARTPRLGRRTVVTVAAVSVVVLIAAVVFAVVMYSKVKGADSDQESRASAQSSAQQFALRMDSFDGSDLGAYIKRVDALLTTKAKKDFSQTFDAFKQVYSQGHTKGTGKVLLSGVGDADKDSATVLVVHDASVKSDYGTQLRHLRWSVSMDKVDGTWRVDSFTPVN